MATRKRNTTPRRPAPRTRSTSRPATRTCSRAEDEVMYLCSVSRSRPGLEIIDLTTEETNEVGQDIDQTPAVQDSNTSTVARNSRRRCAKTIKTKTSTRTTKKNFKKKVTVKKVPPTVPKESEDEPHCLKCRATPTTNKLAAEPGLYASQCGHIYCKQCVGGMVKCIKCKDKLVNLWKIYL